jgi:hypothetical protein
MGDTLLAERRHRHNIDVARRNFQDYPDVGHYDTWLVDLLQELVEHNTGKILYQGWQSVCDYEDSDESFVTTPLHSSDLQKALDDRVECLRRDGSFRLNFSRDVKFLCKAWGVPIPFLPVTKKEEFRLFSKLMLRDMGRFDADQMAKLWIDYVDGTTIFPKLPVQLRSYYKDWERNRRINAQQQRALPDLQLFDKYLKRMTVEPSEERIEGALLPPKMPQPIAETARRDESDGVIRVDNINMGVHADGELNCVTSERKRGRSEGARDTKKRKIRRCKKCVESRDETRLRGAQDCPGRQNQDKCIFVT